MMHTVKKSSLRLVMLGFALSLATGNALADKPDWAKRGQYREAQEYRYQNDQDYRGRNNHHRSYSADYRLRDTDRSAINKYYRDEKRRAQCPPGLAKKNKHCQPPGQYKKWHKGKPIAKHTQYYDLPRGLRSRLSAPQENYRYIRVDDNILLVDKVSNVVIDVIENILR